MKLEIMRIAEKSKFQIRQIEVAKDHIHLLVNSMPNVRAVQIAGKLKQESTIAIWKEHTFWTDGYFVSTTGQAQGETIRKYIEMQG